MKPQIKREVAIASMHKQHRMICFYATSDAVSDFESFGSIIGGISNWYSITVDARYDFDEVVEYIRSYENDQ